MPKLTLIAILLVAASVAAAFSFALPNTIQKTSESGEELARDRVSEPPVPFSARGGSASGGNPASLDQTRDKQGKPASVTDVHANIPKPNCGGTPFEMLHCYRRFYQGLVETTGVRAAIADMRGRYGEPFIKSQCHQLMHAVGNTAAHQYDSVSAAFADGDGLCWSGYYHGVMESVAGAIGKTKLAGELDSICRDIPGKERYSFDYYNCVHGLGHGVMSVLQNELFDSLVLCDNLSGGWERESCWSGAFMENIIADEINHRSKYLKADDPLYPCNAAADNYKTTCYLMQTSRMLALVGGDFSRVFTLCRTVGENYENICYQSLGRDASGRSVSDVERTRNICLLGNDFRERSNCVVGAVKDFISYFHGTTEAKALCAALPEELTKTCLDTAESYSAVL